jgi:hypothetical protein
VCVQVDAQKAETRAATETLVEAEQEMEAVHFEKRQLTAQWRSSLLAIARREEALAAIKEAIHKQEEQERSIVNELARFKKDIQAQQVRSVRNTPAMCMYSPNGRRAAVQLWDKNLQCMWRWTPTKGQVMCHATMHRRVPQHKHRQCCADSAQTCAGPA